MTTVVGVQRRMMELGRVRLGDKGPKGEPRKLGKFRLTSASEALLKAASEVYGGEVRGWTGAPDEGYFELYTEADRMEIVLPPVFSDRDGTPTAPYSQWFELWSAGGCQRRCDGETETLSAKPCLCNPEERACKLTTRVSFMLPRIPGLGVWRLESHGWNAAVLLPGTLEVLALASTGRNFIQAEVRIENKTVKRDGQTRRFIVPVIDLPGTTVSEIAEAVGAPLAINGPNPRPPKPALPIRAPAPPDDPSFQNGEPAHGPSPELPANEAVKPATKKATDHLRVLLVAEGIAAPDVDAAFQRRANENGGTLSAEYVEHETALAEERAKKIEVPA